MSLRPPRCTWPLIAALPVAAAHGAAAAAPSPLGGGESVTLEPVAAPTAARPVVTRRKVYTCVTPGLVTFADRPCGPLPQVREVRIGQDAAKRPGLGPEGETGGGPPRAGRALPHPSGSDRRSGSGDPEEAAARAAQARAASCARLEQAVHELDDRLRSGYSAREAGRLWARWREARDRLREARC